MAQKSKLDKQACFLTSFAMILVVVGHSDITDGFKQLFIYRWVYGFHMSLFMFVSGYLLALTTHGLTGDWDYLSFCWKKIKRLMAPYVFWSVVFFLIKATLISPDQMQHPVELTIGSFAYHTLVKSIGYLWFLPALFTIFVLLTPLIRISNRVKYGHLALLGGAILAAVIYSIGIVPDIFSLSQTVKFTPMFLFGFYYRNNKSDIDQYIVRNIEIVLAASIILSVVSVNMDVSYLSDMSGVLFFVSLSLVLLPHSGRYSVDFSRYTYTIFLLSYIPQMFIRGPLSHIVSVNQYWLSVLSFATGIIFPVLVGMWASSVKNDSFIWKNIKIIIGL